MLTRKPNLTIGAQLAVEFIPSILNADGSVAHVFPRQRNLLLDAGLDRMGGGAGGLAVTQLIYKAVVGSGTNPTYRDSGVVTASQAGNTVTVSAGFLVVGDTGRLLKYDSGQEVYLTYVSPTQATASGGAQTIAASPFTLWYVNDTGLQAELKRSALYTNGAGDNQSTFSGPATWVHKQTFLFAAEVAPVTYNEIGWSHSPTVAANLFGRAVFAVPAVLAVGQQLKVTIFLSVTLSPSVITAVPNVGNNGYNTAGNMMIEWSSAYGGNDGISGINNPAGGSGVSSYLSLEPGLNKQFGLIRTTWAQNAAMTSATTGAALGTMTSANTLTAGAYVAKTFTQDWTALFNLSTGNTADHYGISMGGSYRGWTIKFTTPQAKDAAHTLSFVVRYTWGRVLVNV